MFFVQFLCQYQPKVPLSTRRTLRRHSDTWALREHLNTWRALESHSKGTGAFGHLRYSGTYALWHLSNNETLKFGHLGHLGILAFKHSRHLDTWALKTWEFKTKLRKKNENGIITNEKDINDKIFWVYFGIRVHLF